MHGPVAVGEQRVSVVFAGFRNRPPLARNASLKSWLCNWFADKGDWQGELNNGEWLVAFWPPLRLPWICCRFVFRLVSTLFSASSRPSFSLAADDRPNWAPFAFRLVPAIGSGWSVVNACCCLNATCWWSSGLPAIDCFLSTKCWMAFTSSPFEFDSEAASSGVLRFGKILRNSSRFDCLPSSSHLVGPCLSTARLPLRCLLWPACWPLFECCWVPSGWATLRAVSLFRRASLLASRFSFRTPVSLAGCLAVGFLPRWWFSSRSLWFSLSSLFASGEADSFAVSRSTELSVFLLLVGLQSADRRAKLLGKLWLI